MAEAGTKAKIKRTPFGKQREKCRSKDIAYYEEVRFEVEVLNEKGDKVSTVITRVLMCGESYEGQIMGGQCMAKKCQVMRIIPEPILEDDTDV